MTGKTITLDLEAYGILSRSRRPGQSFSQVIKERLRPVSTAADLKRAVRDVKVSEATLDAVEELVRERSESPARAVDL